MGYRHSVDNGTTSLFIDLSLPLTQHLLKESSILIICSFTSAILYPELPWFRSRHCFEFILLSSSIYLITRNKCVFSDLILLEISAAFLLVPEFYVFPRRKYCSPIWRFNYPPEPESYLECNVCYCQPQVSGLCGSASQGLFWIFVWVLNTITKYVCTQFQLFEVFNLSDTEPLGLAYKIYPLPASLTLVFITITLRWLFKMQIHEPLEIAQ